MRVLAGIGPMAAIALALAAAACAPAEPTPPPAPDSAKALALMAAPPPDSALGKLIETGPVVAGEHLNFERLRDFYARHGFAPVWTADRQKQAEALTDTVMRSRDHGLDPALFHGDILRAADNLPALDRELVLSDAFLAYADALARGAVPVEHRPDDEALTPGPTDISAALDKAIDSPDPAAAIEALAPDTPTYRALRAALADLRDGKPVRDLATREREIEVNLERERWLPRHLPGTRVWVNTADQRLTFYRDGEPVLAMKVVVGQTPRNLQSPEFQVPIDAIWFNPPWTIPDDIAKNEILPKAAADPDYLAKHNLVVLPDGLLQQRAGPNGALGALMFDMNNRFEVYLHATPLKELFLREDRHVSHGCIRVEKPRELAALVMQQSVADIDRAIAPGDTVRTPVPKPVPVFVVYETAFADADGKLQFRPDAYGRDAGIWQALAPKGRMVVAQR
ncbi:MAG TPA: L,D-transpeptidase family protein [Reyranella sp.]|nr:L,D-transpeptidase family protein [Reyranella sp.]